MNIIGVSSDMLDHYQYLVRPMLEEMLDELPVGKLYTVDSILTFVRLREMQLWLVEEGSKINALVVTQIIEYPKARVLDVMFVKGTVEQTLDFFVKNVFIPFAKEKGCEYLRGYGRFGWVRALKELGLNPSLYFDIALAGEKP